MSKINVRSPYFITDNSTSSGSALASAVLYIRIYTGNASTSLGQTPEYVINSTAINGSVTFEVSELVRDYIENTFDGDYTGSVKWFNYNIIRTYANASTSLTAQQNLAVFDGYGYFENGSNPQNLRSALQSNTTIFTNDFANINIPIHVTEDTTVSYLKDGEIIFTKDLVYSTNSADQVQYVQNSSLDADVFKKRVDAITGTTLEAFNCVKNIASDVYQEFDADSIYIDKGGVIEVIKIEEVEECKYNPYKVTFVNKFGVLQDLWFFKRSNLSLQTQQESYKANIVTNGTYSINSRQKTVFNKTGMERLQLNTGFYPESYNEIFRQLTLSEEVWIKYDGDTLPITVMSSSLNYKTSVNDKLINYTIDVEFANNKINNIR
tara:strand:+ start:411 stop:1547 length:1137 start_codon:yes stop_codon:yes gene_type:complete